MGSFEENYGKDALRTFTENECAQLRKLHEQLDVKFDEIASFMADKLGYTATDPRGREDAAEAIDRWEEDAEMADNPVKPSGSLQHLLSEHHSISEQIMDIRDEAIERG
jgi:hypothetical protein